MRYDKYMNKISTTHLTYPGFLNIVYVNLMKGVKLLQFYFIFSTKVKPNKKL